MDRRRAANVYESVLCSVPGSEKLRPNGLVDGTERAFKGGEFKILLYAVALAGPWLDSVVVMAPSTAHISRSQTRCK